MFKAKSLYFFLILLIIGSNAMGQLPGRLGQMGNRGAGSRNQGQTSTSQRPGQDAENQQPGKRGKILDDSTKQIYGPKTVAFFKETDLLNNRYIRYEIDTVKTDFHRFNFIQKNNYLFQDLGNMGTASRPVFFTPVKEIGAQTGYSAFDLYLKNSEEVKYYDTKSPFTEMFYVSGGRGESMVRFDFNRSINSRWNTGISIQNFNSRKQYGGLGAAGQQATRHWSVVGHNSYFNKDSSYIILANYNFSTHKSNDDGGVLVQTSSGGGISSEDPFTNTAETLQNRRQLHIYQQYKMGNGFQLYHVFDGKGSENSFVDSDLANGLAQKVYIIGSVLPENTASTLDSLSRRYRLFQNKIGVKGFYKGMNYRVHYKRRDYAVVDSLDRNQVGGRLRGAENFVGGWLNYYFKDSTKAFAELEYLIGGDYNLRAEWARKVLTFGFYQVSSRPTLIQQRFYSSIGTWQNDFKNQFSNSFYGSFSLKVNDFELKPQAQYHIIGNYIYFDSLYKAQQESDIITFLQIGSAANYHKGKFINQNQIFVNAHTGPNRIPYPVVMINSRVSYDFTYAKKLDLQVGLELHYKTAYYAQAYQPATQQFYLQDKIKVKPGLLGDAFVNFQMNKVRFLVKYSQLNQLVFGDYYVGPNFKGVKGAISFGLHWPLFD